MTYHASISRTNPACSVFLLDQSGSMSGKFGIENFAKAKGAADAINHHLKELILRCTRGDGVRDYFDIAVIGYGSKGGSASTLIRDGFVKISWLSEHWLRIEESNKMEFDVSRSTVERRVMLPVWFDPLASSDTPMCSALKLAVELISRWIISHPDSFPPTVINITDGEATDGDPENIANRLTRLSTTDGQVLLFNCHISGESIPPIMFPMKENELPVNKLARKLFRMSSIIPQTMLCSLKRDGILIGTGSRGFSFNADLVALARFIEIGTRAAGELER